MKNIIQLTIIVLSLTLFACDGDLKRQIDSYRGDGKIEYLEAPGPLGASGVRIKFPKIDLSKNYQETFDMSGIPLGNSYTVGLVVPPPNHYRFWPGTLNYRILKDGKIIREVRENLDKYSQEQSSKRRMYYFYRSDDLESFYLEIDSPDSIYLFEVEFITSKLPKKVPAYLVIECGGFK